MQAISRIDRGWPRRARILVPALVVIACAGAVAGCGGSKTTSTPASTALPTTTTVAKKKTAPKLPTKIPASAAPQAKAYIAAHSADMKLVVRYESDVQTAIAEVENSPLMTPLQQSTQTALNNISKVLPRFHGPYKQDALGLTEQQISKQANGVKASMKTLLGYVAFSTPATLNEYTTQYQNVVLAWNKAVKAIWTVAKALKPPTICTTC